MRRVMRRPIAARDLHVKTNRSPALSTEAILKTQPDPSFRYDTARHTDVATTFARVEWQRREERRTGQYSGVLRASVAMSFREQKLATRHSEPESGRTPAGSSPPPPRRQPWHHG